MAEFQELIKNFDRIRDYMRQFYIYGFKARTEFDGKSARTYDNERRRIESWLAVYTRADYTSKGKHVYINVDSKEIPQNPLYTAWKSKSFTDNDLMLHFFILDQMIEDGNENAGMAKAGAANPESPSPGGLTAGELCDRILRGLRRGFRQSDSAAQTKGIRVPWSAVGLEGQKAAPLPAGSSARP